MTPSDTEAKKLGILAYGSLIDDRGEEINNATDMMITEDMSAEVISTPFNVEFARSSSTRKGAPTLVPVITGGAQVTARIIVLRDEISEAEAQNMLWRRETRNAGHSKRPTVAKPNSVLIDALSNFHGINTVYYTRIAPNINPLSATQLAELAIKSAKEIKKGSNEEGKDGISYLIAAKRNGITTPLSAEYEQEILKLTETKSLEASLEKLTR
jgi:hypothetical protein